MARSQAAARPDARSVGGVIVRSRGFALINACAEHLKPVAAHDVFSCEVLIVYLISFV